MNVAEKGTEAQSATREGRKLSDLRFRRPWPFKAGEVVAEVRRLGEAFRPIHVQVLIQREVICGRLVEVQVSGQGWDRFKVDTSIGTYWLGSRHVRRCSGLDGRCICARDDGEARREPRPAAALALSPLGNTGTTVGAGA